MAEAGKADMSTRDLDRRLARIEARRHVGTPTAIFSSRPLAEGEAEEAIANWQEWVADGRASIMGQCLFIRTPRMTAEEWMAATAHHRGEVIH